MMGLLGGHVDATVQIQDVVLPHVRSGKVRLLATFGDKRWKWTPDVPTCKELGYNVALSSYIALGAPKGIPKPILERLRTDFNKVRVDPEFVKVLEEVYFIPTYVGPDDYQKYVNEQYVAQENFFKELGLHKSQKK